MKCTHDEDGDGVPDDEDILDNALKYIATCPKYKGKYYEGGYPTDNYGVCSDIIAFALRDAGYDLRKLVNEDIKANPSSYEDETPDIDIDFRRVRNLLAYFKNHANSLTTDISKISEWQAGDIVIFDGHIGLLSDRRNADGVPYIIHHVSGWQESYEEDILGTRDDLVAHFRVW